MKKIAFLPSFLICLLLLMLASCESGDSSDPAPKTDKATFRVEYHQSGDYEKFYKSITIGGGEFKNNETGEFIPPVLFTSDLKKASYTFESKDVNELVIGGISNFRVVEAGPATLMMRFVIYKNGKKLDERVFTNDHLTGEQNIYLKYKANE